MSSNASDQEQFEGDAPLPFRKRAQVSASETTNVVDGHKTYYLNVPGGEIFAVGEEEYFLCTRLDARISFIELKAAFEARFDTTLTSSAFASFAANMMDLGVLEDATREAEGNQTVMDRILDPDDPDPRATPFRRTLFNPTALFDAMARTRSLWPAFSVIAILSLGVGITVTAQNTDQISQAFSEVRRGIGLLLFLPLSLFLINMTSILVQGATAQANGAPIHSFGLIFYFGFFPRFYIDQHTFGGMSLKAQRRTYAAPLFTRMFLYGLGCLFWVMLDGYGNGLSGAAILLAHMALAALLITALPLLPIDGYHWMAALLGRPNMRERSLRFLKMQVMGRKAPEEMTAADRVGAILFGTASLLAVIVLITVVYTLLAIMLESSLGGAGIGIFACLMLLSLVWLHFARKAAERVSDKVRNNARALRDSQGQLTRTSDTSAAVINLKTGSSIDTPSSSAGPLNVAARRDDFPWSRTLMISGGLIVLVLLFLPYTYKPGGQFHVLPDTRSQVRAQIEGEVVELLVKEGEMVEVGTPIARLRNFRAERNIRVVEADLAGGQAALQRLLEGASQEEIALAQSQLRRLEAEVETALAELQRQRQLEAEGMTPPRMLQLAQRNYADALNNRDVASANLELVSRSATPTEIAMIEADIVGFEEELAFRQDELERTLLVANMAGRVATPEHGLKLGDYLNIGQLFLEIEDQSKPRIEIALPQSEARFITVGQTVQVKSWGYSHQNLNGRVLAVAPSVSASNGRPVLRVIAEIDASDLAMPSDMTGFAKVETERMPVWRAYLLFIIRFFQVEVWSWFP